MSTQISQLGRDWKIRLRDGDQVRSFLRKLNNELGETSTIRKKIAQKAKLIIVNRTKSGKDIKGSTFKKGKDGNAVNLVDTGQMLNQVTYKITGFVIVIYVEQVGNRWIVAEVHNYGMQSGRRSGRFKMPKREWFGLSARDLESLNMMLKRHFDSFIKRYAGQ